MLRPVESDFNQKPGVGPPGAPAEGAPAGSGEADHHHHDADQGDQRDRLLLGLAPAIPVATNVMHGRKPPVGFCSVDARISAPDRGRDRARPWRRDEKTGLFRGSAATYTGARPAP